MSTKTSATKKSDSAKTSSSTTTRKSQPKKTEEVVAPPVVADPAVAESSDKKARKRRDVSKESVDNDFDSLHKRIEKEILRLKDSEKARGIKFLRSVNKAIKILHGDTKRMLKLKKKNNRKKNPNSGFLKPVKLSPELLAFTGWDVNNTYSRVDVTKFICEYVKSNNLSDPDDKRNINPDAKMVQLLKYDPKNPPRDMSGSIMPLTYFRLQQYLKVHFIKTEAPPAEATKDPKAPKKAPKKKVEKKVEVTEEEGESLDD